MNLKQVKVFNRRKSGGLFHYGHFFHDCLMPEILSGILNYNKVIRIFSPHQSIGNFDRIYKELGIQNIEISKDEFEAFEAPLLKINGLGFEGFNKKNCEEFKKTINNFLQIPDQKTSNNIILIKRSSSCLLNEPTQQSFLKQKGGLRTNEMINWFKNGNTLREINRIDLLESFLSKEVENFKPVILENLTLKQQIEIFMSAKTVVGIHGAGLCNILFCNKGANVFEVSCPNKDAVKTFENISSSIGLNYFKVKNDINYLKNLLKKYINDLY